MKTEIILWLLVVTMSVGFLYEHSRVSAARKQTERAIKVAEDWETTAQRAINVAEHWERVATNSPAYR